MVERDRVRLTIAIPFYRNVDYLSDALRSLQAQDLAEWRGLVVDDGEEEQGARELVRSLDDARIDYQRNERNLGMVGNWNRCIDAAESDLVTLLHADDRLLPSYAQTMLELSRRHPDAAAYFCAASIIDARGRPSASMADAVKRWFIPRGEGPIVLAGPSSLRRLMAGNFVMCPTLCFRRSRIGERRFSPRWRQVQDLDFTAGLLMDGEQLVGSRVVSYAYRRHPESATSLQSASRLRFEEEFSLFDEIAERAESIGWRSVARTSRRKTIVKLHLLYRALREAVSARPGRAFSTLRYLRERW